MSEREGWEGRDQYLKTHFVDIFFLNMKNRDKKKTHWYPDRNCLFSKSPKSGWLTFFQNSEYPEDNGPPPTEF